MFICGSGEWGLSWKSVLIRILCFFQSLCWVGFGLGFCNVDFSLFLLTYHWILFYNLSLGIVSVKIVLQFLQKQSCKTIFTEMGIPLIFIYLNSMSSVGGLLLFFPHTYNC